MIPSQEVAKEEHHLAGRLLLTQRKRNRRRVLPSASCPSPEDQNCLTKRVPGLPPIGAPTSHVPSTRRRDAVCFRFVLNLVGAPGISVLLEVEIDGWLGIKKEEAWIRKVQVNMVSAATSFSDFWINGLSPWHFWDHHTI